jgi:hypothetical protein
VEFEDTANELLSFACGMQVTGVEVSLGDPFECQTTRSAHRLSASIDLSHVTCCSETSDLCYLRSEDRGPHDPFQTRWYGA